MRHCLNCGDDIHYNNLHCTDCIDTIDIYEDLKNKYISFLDSYNALNNKSCNDEYYKPIFYKNIKMKKCRVCKKSINKLDDIIIMPKCKHYFHFKCVNIFCPICSNPIVIGH